MARRAGRAEWVEVVSGQTDEDYVPALVDSPVSVRGDRWALGDHRIVCGDATAPSDVDRLMSRDAADLVFTDPPYNVDYEGYTGEKLKIQGDRMSDQEFKQFLEASFRSYRLVVKPGASLYICHPSSWQREFQNALEAAGFAVQRAKPADGGGFEQVVIGPGDGRKDDGLAHGRLRLAEPVPANRSPVPRHTWRRT